jgi:hypothetical protein
VQGFDTKCKVGNSHDGYAHVVEQSYDDSFKLWYGCVGLACTDEEGYALVSQEDVHMQLPDGRSMTVRLLQPHLRDAAPSLGERCGSGFGCYFISTSPLVNMASLFPGFMLGSQREPVREGTSSQTPALA